MALKLHDISKTLLHILTEDKSVSRGGIFGSIARNEAGIGSDIDIIIDYRHDENNLFAYFVLCERIESEFKRLYKRNVSLVEWSALSYDEYKHIGEMIIREVVWVYDEKQKQKQEA